MSEKVKETEPEKEQEVSMTIYVPLSVHRKIKVYQTRIGDERQTDYTVVQAYAEFLKEYTRAIAI